MSLLIQAPARKIRTAASATRLARQRPDPVEPAIPGHALDDAEDGDQGPHDDHRPERPASLGGCPIGVVANEKERGHGQELDALPPRRLGVERPSRAEERHGSNEHQREKEQRREPAGRKLQPELPVPQRAEHVGRRHGQHDQLGDRFRPGLDRAESERGEDEEEEGPRLDEAFGPRRAHRRLTSSTQTLPPRLPSGPAAFSRRRRTRTRLVPAGIWTRVSSGTQSAVVPEIVRVSASTASSPGETTSSFSPELAVKRCALASARRRYSRPGSTGTNCKTPAK